MGSTRSSLEGGISLTCALSLLLNTVLLLFLYASGPLSQKCPPTKGAADGKSDLALSLGLVGHSPQCRDEQLRRAEATYEHNQRRRSALVGTSEEQTLPLSGEPLRALARLRPLTYQNVWLQEYMLFPRYPCAEEERVGMWGDGGKWVCFQPLHKGPQDLVVYSIGSNGDTTFEEGMWELLKVTSHTFDPFVSQHTMEWLRTLPYITFHEYGLSLDNTTEVQLQPGQWGKAKGIHTILKELGHSFVDVFKIDCEGCESGFVQHLANTTTRGQPIFGQILMEIHDVSNFPLESVLMKNLHDLGFRLFHLEPNFFSTSCWEVAFIHESLCYSKS